MVRVLNEEFYAQKLQNLIYPNLFTDCFMKIHQMSGEKASWNRL